MLSRDRSILVHEGLNNVATSSDFVGLRHVATSFVRPHRKPSKSIALNYSDVRSAKRRPLSNMATMRAGLASSSRSARIDRGWLVMMEPAAAGGGGGGGGGVGGGCDCDGSAEFWS